MDNRILFGIMTLIFNSYGVPCFMQGNVKAGILRIVFGTITFGVIGVINMVQGIILGIEILKMTDDEYETRKGTFAAGIPLE
jgi:hypothetical protein